MFPVILDFEPTEVSPDGHQLFRLHGYVRIGEDNITRVRHLHLQTGRSSLAFQNAHGMPDLEN